MRSFFIESTRVLYSTRINILRNNCLKLYYRLLCPYIHIAQVSRHFKSFRRFSVENRMSYLKIYNPYCNIQFYFIINVIRNVRNEIFINKTFEFMRFLCDFQKLKFFFHSFFAFFLLYF